MTTYYTSCASHGCGRTVTVVDVFCPEHMPPKRVEYSLDEKSLKAIAELTALLKARP